MRAVQPLLYPPLLAELPGGIARAIPFLGGVFVGLVAAYPLRNPPTTCCATVFSYLVPTSPAYDASDFATAMKRRRYCTSNLCLFLLGAQVVAAVEPFTLTEGDGLKWVAAAGSREGHAAACLRNGLDPTPSEVLLSDQVTCSEPICCWGLFFCVYLFVVCQTCPLAGGIKQTAAWCRYTSGVCSHACVCVTQQDGQHTSSQ